MSVKVDTPVRRHHLVQCYKFVCEGDRAAAIDYLSCLTRLCLSDAKEVADFLVTVTRDAIVVTSQEYEAKIIVIKEALALERQRLTEAYDALESCGDKLGILRQRLEMSGMYDKVRDIFEEVE